MAAATAWYRDGTIAVTNGSKAVTGTGTSWLSQILPADLLFITDANGNLTAGPYEVETVTSDTAMTLKAVFPGTNASAAKYCVIRHFNNTLPADLSSRLSKLIANYQITVDQFITFLTSAGTVTLTGLDGTTYSVQGLLGFANQVPDHNASDAAHGMSATGRTILRGDGTAGRNALSLAGHDKLSVSVDAINGQVTLVGGSAGNITFGQFANGAWLGNTGTGAAAPFRFGVASGEAGRITVDRRWIFGSLTDDGVSEAQIGGALRVVSNIAAGDSQNIGYGLGVSFGNVGKGLLLHQSVNTDDERVYLTNNAQTYGSGYTGQHAYNKSGASASTYLQLSGNHFFMFAPPGTAGSAINWTFALRLVGQRALFGSISDDGASAAQFPGAIRIAAAGDNIIAGADVGNNTISVRSGSNYTKLWSGGVCGVTCTSTFRIAKSNFDPLMEINYSTGMVTYLLPQTATSDSNAAANGVPVGGMYWNTTSNQMARRAS